MTIEFTNDDTHAINDPYLTNIYIGYKLRDIDEEYINIMFNYESTEIEKFASLLRQEIEAYVTNEKLFRSLKIMPVSEVLTEFDLKNYCIWASYTVTETNGIIKLGNEKIERFGFEALQTNPYVMIDFYSGLIENKISKNDSNLKEDIEKIVDAVTNFPYLGSYAKFRGYLYIGFALRKVGDSQKANVWFKKIYDNEENLGKSTVADFCKSIGEIFIEDNEIREGIEWFKKGLEWNPKLPIKKKVRSLEENI